MYRHARVSLAQLFSLFSLLIGDYDDGIRVATPAMLWSEWLSNGPTIVFLTIALVDKKDLSKMSNQTHIKPHLCKRNKQVFWSHKD